MSPTTAKMGNSYDQDDNEAKIDKKIQIKEDFVEKKQEPESSKDFVEKKKEPESSKDFAEKKEEPEPSQVEM